MTAAHLLDHLAGLGFELTLGQDDALIVRPGARLTDELRQSIREQRPGLVAILRDPDPRVVCIACGSYRQALHRCANHRRAGLLTSEISPDLAYLKQHCRGFRRITLESPS